MHHVDGTVSTELFVEEGSAAYECLGRLAFLKPPAPGDRLIIQVAPGAPTVCGVCDNLRCAAPDRATGNLLCTSCDGPFKLVHSEHRWSKCPAFTL
ncbi:hypothetical protein [Kitasatospora sp. NPDC088783]|uniref:hypothetical protein n=1 Tax=Kitasatospora sp. NPDC088783 TaxID=3364077 RepID=UPI0037FE8623